MVVAIDFPTVKRKVAGIRRFAELPPESADLVSIEILHGCVVHQSSFQKQFRKREMVALCAKCLRQMDLGVFRGLACGMNILQASVYSREPVGLKRIIPKLGARFLANGGRQSGFCF